MNLRPPYAVPTAVLSGKNASDNKRPSSTPPAAACSTTCRRTYGGGGTSVRPTPHARVNGSRASVIRPSTATTSSSDKPDCRTQRVWTVDLAPYQLGAFQVTQAPFAEVPGARPSTATG